MLGIRASMLGSTSLSRPSAIPVASKFGGCAFLFGAGASAFCDGVAPERPPLGNKLFEKLCRFDAFFEAFPDELKDEFRANFEKGMATFTSTRNAEVFEFLCKMSLYFLQFTIKDPAVNLYSRFAAMMKKLPDEFCLTTLNYDLLLDAALIAEGLSSGWEPKSRVLKIHGAPNLLVGEDDVKMFEEIAFVGTSYANTTGLPVRVRSPDRARAYCEDIIRYRRGFAPAISAYAVGKRVYDSPEFIENTQRTFAKLVTYARSIVLVGVELNEDDSHLWEPIAASKARIGVVNPAFAQYEKWGARRGRSVQLICGTAAEMTTSHADALIRFMRRT
jgi:hypothetical protein